MFRESSIYKAVVCSVCGHILVYRPAVQALPDFCPACGTKSDTEPGKGVMENYQRK